MVRLSVFVFLFCIAVPGQEFRIKAFTDTSEYMIGDHIRLHFDIEHPKGISFAEPVFRDSIENIDVISISSPVVTEKNNLINTKYEIVLSRYDSSDIVIQPVTFYYWYGEKKDRAVFLVNSKTASEDTSLKSARSNPVSFRVNAVKVNVNEDIKDVKAPITIPPDWKIILLYIAAGMLIAAAAVYIYRKYRKKKGAEDRPVIIIPPHVVALGSLHELENKKLWQNGLVKEFHTEVTGIVRRYFEERFGLPALELTSGETVELLKAKNEASGIIEDTAEFLSNADLVKFAKFVPMNSVNDMMLSKAYIIVEKTIPAAEKPETANVQ